MLLILPWCIAFYPFCQCIWFAPSIMSLAVFMLLILHDALLLHILPLYMFYLFAPSIFPFYVSRTFYLQLFLLKVLPRYCQCFAVNDDSVINSPHWPPNGPPGDQIHRSSRQRHVPTAHLLTWRTRLVSCKTAENRLTDKNWRDTIIIVNKTDIAMTLKLLKTQEKRR